MFVDASGDDGYVFRETSDLGSSYSFVVSCFMTTPTDYAHNVNVLLSMKRAMFVKPEQEIKSTALRRSRYADKVYNELQTLKGICYSLIADKKLIQECRPASNPNFYFLTQIAHEELSGVTHTFPYFTLSNSNLITESDKVLIVMDNMKKREMDSVRNILGTEISAEKYDLIFRDSKDRHFPLIQVADIIAGTIRNYYETCLPLKTHNFYCKLCMTQTHVNDNSVLGHACQNRKLKKLFFPYINHKHFNAVMKLHQSENRNTLPAHFVMLPIDQTFYFTYIDCLIMKHKKRS